MAERENVLTKTDDFIKWFLPKVEKMPRNYKFLFGDRMIQLQLDLLENLIDAYYGREKLRPLAAANLQIEKLRHLLRIATDMKWMNLQQFEFATQRLNEIGSMVGGWIKQVRGRANEPEPAG